MNYLNNISPIDELETNINNLTTSIIHLDNKYNGEIKRLDNEINEKQDLINISPLSYIYSDEKGEIKASQKILESDDTLQINSTINNIKIPETDDSEFIIADTAQILNEKIFKDGYICNLPLINRIPSIALTTINTLISSSLTLYELYLASSHGIFVIDIGRGAIMNSNIINSRTLNTDIILSPNNISCKYFSEDCGKILYSEPITKRIIENQNIKITNGINISLDQGYVESDFKCKIFDGLTKLLISKNDKTIRQCDDIIYDESKKEIQATYADLRIKNIYSINSASESFYKCESFMGGKLLMSQPLTKNIVEAPDFTPFRNPLYQPTILELEAYEIWQSLKGRDGINGINGVDGKDASNLPIVVSALAGAGVFAGLLSEFKNFVPSILQPSPPEIPPIQIDPQGSIALKGDVSMIGKISQLNDAAQVLFQVEQGIAIAQSITLAAGVTAATIYASQLLTAEAATITTVNSTSVSTNSMKSASLELTTHDIKISDIQDGFVFENKVGQIQNKAIDNCILGDLIPCQSGTFNKLKTNELNINTLKPINKTDEDGLDLNIMGGSAIKEANNENILKGGDINITAGMGNINGSINLYSNCIFHQNIQMNIRTIYDDTKLDNSYLTILADSSLRDIEILLPFINNMTSGLSYTIIKKSNLNKVVVKCSNMNERIFSAVNSIELLIENDTLEITSDGVLSWN